MHYEKRIVHGKEMLVKVYPLGRAIGASNTSRYSTKNPTGDTLARSQAISKLKWGTGTGCKSLNTKPEQNP